MHNHSNSNINKMSNETEQWVQTALAKAGPKGRKGATKRRKNRRAPPGKRELEFKDDLQEYAQVTKLLGDCHLQAMCMDGRIQLCKIRGKLRKRVWVKVNDFILISLREFQPGVADVIHLYKYAEVQLLRGLNEIPSVVQVDGKTVFLVKDGDNNVVEFLYNQKDYDGEVFDGTEDLQLERAESTFGYEDSKNSFFCFLDMLF